MRMHFNARKTRKQLTSSRNANYTRMRAKDIPYVTLRMRGKHIRDVRT